jgi:N-glycosylase/DNA lyase
MNSNTIDENKIVAALLTVALASSQPTSSPEDILSNYGKFLSELSPKQKEIPAVQEHTGRKFRADE